MPRGGKREGAGRKPTGNPPKTVVRRIPVEIADQLEKFEQLINELAERSDQVKRIGDFKVYKLKGKLVIRVDELVEAGIITLE
jgi:hypothetical protein